MGTPVTADKDVYAALSRIEGTLGRLEAEVCGVRDQLRLLYNSQTDTESRVRSLEQGAVAHRVWAGGIGAVVAWIVSWLGER